MKSLIEAARFPLSTTWQPAEFRPLSDRTYNIAASCNVPSFSGWENEKFSTTLLRRRCRNDAHWLNVVGKKLTGCFPTEIENEMKNQFDLLENLEPGIPNFKFVSKLKLVKDSHWYKQKVHEDGDPDLADIAQFGEEDILLLFLSFSKMNLMVAEMDDDKNKARRREQLALSVLLPLVSHVDSRMREKKQLTPLDFNLIYILQFFISSATFASTRTYGTLYR